MTQRHDTRLRSVAGRGAAIAVLATVPAACVLPVQFEDPISPRIAGWYRGAGDLPVAGARVVVTEDDECRKPLAIDTTDAGGRFELAPTTVTRRGIWLVPAFERFHSTYWLCASARGTTLDLAYQGLTLLRGAPPPAAVIDSIVCLDWRWRDSARVTCAGPNQTHVIQTAGAWTEGSATGYYRLIVVEPVWQLRYGGLYLQWIERGPAGGADVVRETVALHQSPRVMRVDQAMLQPGREGVPACVIVRLTLHETSIWTWSTQRERGVIALGAPGDIRGVSSCMDAASR